MDDDIKNLIYVYLAHFNYDSGPMFRGKDRKGKINRETLNYVFKKVKAKAELQKEFKIHSFRHYFINTLRRNGIDLATIQKLAGHKDINVTKDYCNITPEEKITAIKTIKVLGL